NVKVDMGSPVLEPSKIPALVDSSLSTIVQGFEATLVSMGNPHCIIFCDEDAEIMAKSYGSSIETDKIFPEKTNVEFVNIVSENKVRVNVWERGCGITLACGTGACATVVAGVNRKLISENTEVVLPGGSLNIFYNKAGDNHVYMQGPAQFVFSGEFEE
ncbi:MAG: diaminopimelate epimerase, partial [Candidatus Gastranaerophilales bacterium]|nr:diaminopimelate epimerase [Candidatus Gastranaerophilales bacterium]